MKVDEAIARRSSVRSFSSKPVRWDVILEAIDAANQAPFAGNINHLKFIIVEDSSSISMLAHQSQQDWVADASLVVLVCSNDDKLHRVYDDRGQMYAKQQTGAAIENFLLKLTDLGLATCWIGAYNDSAIKDSLRIPQQVTIEAVLPIGYEKGKVVRPKKEALENTIFWEKWGSKKRAALRKETRN